MEENINVYDKKDRKIISPKTYITKEKFVEIISNLDYKYVESADIEFVTVFMNKDLTITITLEAKESIDKAIERLLTAYEKEKEKNESLIKERATEIVYVDKNFVRKDKIKPIQIIDLDGKIHNVYKIEEE